MAKRQKTKKSANQREELPGVSLEKAVARIQQMMDPNSVVSHDEKLEDRIGNLRQFDVVIRGTFGGRPMLGVIECKDHNRKKGPSEVEAFSRKSDHLRANLRLMVSRIGFTKQALKLAQHDGIGCLSLVPNDPNQVGWSIGNFWYGIIKRWTNLHLRLVFPERQAPITQSLASQFSPETVTWQGLPVIRWFLRELITNRSADREPGAYLFNIDFDRVYSLEIAGQGYQLKGLSCSACFVCSKKRKWVSWSGDAFYDWHKNAIAVPGGVSIVSSSVETDPQLWDDYDGEVPSAAAPRKDQSFTMIFNFGQQFPNDLPAPDLSLLGPITVSGPLADR